MAERFEQYIIQNRFLDSSLQNAFIKGISGCTEHNTVMHEVISHAKSKSRTVRITWFDLADAFGSVNHELIHYTLNRLDIPANVKLYIKNLYGSLSGKIVSKDWMSNEFMFKKGIFQGAGPTVPADLHCMFRPYCSVFKRKKKWI